MNDDAIKNDVSVTAEGEADAGNQQAPAEGKEAQDRAPAPKSSRESAMEALVKKHNEAMGIEVPEKPEGQQADYSDDGEEFDDPDDDQGQEQDTGHQDEPGADDDPDAGEAAQGDDPLKKAGYYRNAAGDLVVKMKINGVEKEVKAEQVMQYLQKDIAGDTKLQQASERERRLQEREQLLQQREQQIQQSLSKRPPEKLGDDEAKAQAKAILDKMWDGDTDSAAEELAKALQRGDTTVDPNEILTQAEQRALSAIEQRERQQQQKQWEQSVDEGNRELRAKHAEIYDDPHLFSLVNSETARIHDAQNAGDPEFASLSPKDIILKAAENVQTWMEQRGAKPGKPQQGRDSRKRNLTPMPRGQNRTPTRKQPQEVDNSPAAVIARMRQSRAM